MRKIKIWQRVALFVVIGFVFALTGFKEHVYAEGTVFSKTFSKGTAGNDVSSLQGRFKEMKFFVGDLTDYFGFITKNPVMRFIKSVGIGLDRVVADDIKRASGRDTTRYAYKEQSLSMPRTRIVSRGGLDRKNILIPWFDGVENIFSEGIKVSVTDVDTGITFWAARTGGSSHSDTETLSSGDTMLLKEIYGGEWSWERRAVIVTIGTQRIAASMTGMPHAGREDIPARVIVEDRSEGYGTGVNYDSIKGNGMSGHFDIHFLRSRTHGTDRIDERHQAMAQKAARSYSR